MVSGMVMVAKVDGVPRVARIVAVEPLTARWRGTESEEHLSSWPADRIVVDEASLAGLLLTDPAQGLAKLADAGAGLELAIDVLRASGEPMSIAEIKEVIVDWFGVSASVVDRALKGIASQLQGLDGLRQVTLSMGQDERPGRGEGSTGPRASRKQPVTSTVMKFMWEPVPAAPASTSSTAAIGSEPEAPTEPLTPAHATVVRMIAGDYPPAVNLGALPVIDVADALLATEEKALANACAEVWNAGRLDLGGLLLATPRASKAVAALLREWRSLPAAQPALADALEWVANGPQPKTTQRLFGLLVDGSPPPTQPVVEVALSILSQGNVDLRASSLAVIAAASPETVETAVAGVELPRVAMAVNREPLATRARLLRAIGRVDADVLHVDAAWGTSIGVSDLVAVAGQRPEADLLLDDWARVNVVEPLVTAHTREVSMRSALAEVFGWPSSILTAVPPEVIAASARRCAANDSHFAAVLSDLGSERLLADLRQELDAARVELVSARQAEEAARYAEAAATDAEQRSFARASRAEREQVHASEREMRQAMIDGLRGLIDGLVAVGRLETSHETSTVLEELLRTARRYGIRPIGDVGGECDYDSTKHESLGDLGGGRVVIRERGFELEEATGSVVLRRALVTDAPVEVQYRKEQG
jgi:hypothetical protein